MILKNSHGNIIFKTGSPDLSKGPSFGQVLGIGAMWLDMAIFINLFSAISKWGFRGKSYLRIIISLKAASGSWFCSGRLSDLMLYLVSGADAGFR